MTIAPVATATSDSDDDQPRGWSFRLDLAAYDRRVELVPAELAALGALGPDGLRRDRRRGVAADDLRRWTDLARLVGPLDDAAASMHFPSGSRDYLPRRWALDATALVLRQTAELGRAYWGWTDWDWLRLLCPTAREFSDRWVVPIRARVRAYALGFAYLLGRFGAFHQLGMFDRHGLASLVFGHARVDEQIDRARDILDRWGYRKFRGDHLASWRGTVSLAFLVNRSPLLQDLTTASFVTAREHPAFARHRLADLHCLQRVVASLGHCDVPEHRGGTVRAEIEGTSPAWVDWVERWCETSTRSPKNRQIVRTLLGRVGRWLAAEHPEITEPGQWTRQTSAAWVAAVDRMRVGDYVQHRKGLKDREGAPHAPRTKTMLLAATRMFFRDCQEWEWIPRRFDPARAFAVPRTLAGMIGTDPRVITDDVWAKLLSAGLNLDPEDLPRNGGGAPYPLELVRAITMTWLFAGLRSDEITRLRVGCIRWQHHDQPIPGNARDVLATDAVCLLDVPVNKTGTAFTKPVDPLLGQAIEAWQTGRPEQPRARDRKTGEQVDPLFSVRAASVSKNYINNSIIPTLCRKAGVPSSDVRGKITSHRARSTIATQLYNAKEPMTLFELQAWLGHRSPNTTQHYAKISPSTLTRAYRDAGYFERNLRTIEVLIDRDAVASGATGSGEPWQHYDLGHGYCTYTFFEQCPHRMVCARCDFYTPKDSSKAQLLEAKDNLQRMRATIPLTDDEQAAVDDGHEALNRLLARLAETPTPAGPSPRNLGSQLPIIEVRHGDPDSR